MKERIPIRLSHLLTHCSVGAVFAGPQYLMTAKDTSEWTDKTGNVAGRQILYVERVRKALGIAEELWEPPVAYERDKSKGLVDGVCIPAIRFPSWMRCPDCGLLYYKPWRNGDDTIKPFCTACRDKHQRTYHLIQVTSIMVHPHGFMADVPWHFLVHLDAKNPEQKNCKRDFTFPYLKLKESTVHFSSWDLRCGRCGVSRTVREGYQEIPYGKAPVQPWLKTGTDEQIESDAKAKILSITDMGVHLPQLKTALIIPPESRIRKGTVIDSVYSSSESRRRIESARFALARKQEFRQLATKLRCSPTEVEAAWEAIENKSYPPDVGNMTPGQLMEDEYKALVNEIPDLQDDEDFVTHHKTTEWKERIKTLSRDSKNHQIVRYFNRLVAVNRLKEIRIFKGFTRLFGDETIITPPDIDGSTKRLPAIEHFGEGIFLTLDETLLSSWEKIPSVYNRAAIFRARFEKSGIRFEPEIVVSPRLILLHTLSHLLIRQLESDAGYPAASLTERIYCKTGPDPMAGILIYVAVPDIVGSLGGLVEQAEPRRMLSLLSSVFDHALWCSRDPVCAEHDGQGPNILNRAACHACALIPEPCCAYANTLLDRTFIKGSIKDNMPGLFESQKLTEMGHGT